jgi:hypothetical protein
VSAFSIFKTFSSYLLHGSSPTSFMGLMLVEHDFIVSEYSSLLVGEDSISTLLFVLILLFTTFPEFTFTLHYLDANTSSLPLSHI